VASTQAYGKGKKTAFLEELKKREAIEKTGISTFGVTREREGRKV